MGPFRAFDYIVLSPPGTPDAALPVAGSRADAIGILNLEYASDQAAALDEMARLTRHGRGRLGVLLDSGDSQLLTRALSDGGAALGFVILAGPHSEDLSQQIRTIHDSGRKAFAVATSLPQARAVAAAGVDAVIAKGHESAGWVGEESSFVLLQRLISEIQIPVWVQGGVGLHSAAACKVAGAAGVVLDSQLLLARESPLQDRVKARIEQLDGSETVCLGANLGAQFRAYSRPDLAPARELGQVETALLLDDQDSRGSSWRVAVRERVDWQDLQCSVLAIGQDAAFAADLASRFRTVGGIIGGLDQAISAHLQSAQALDPLGEGEPLAQSHGTRYPIVQGPMTRVSDRAEFAAAVAGAGALPFLALALMRAPDVKELLAQTKELLGDQPWGVGILGFVPPQLRAEQLEVIRHYRPPFALIAGGRPDQARVLEDEGIATYLHVPSPGLLHLYLKDGARRFVFEGRECGGHVGPRTSFVLWDTMVRILLEDLPAGADPADYHVLFAGGIHDGMSAAMVAALAAPLAERGVRVGVLLGTAYLFTEEAVASGAITSGFQSAAVSCDETVLLESGPGHATRSLPSPFVDDFNREKHQLIQSAIAPEELRNRLEELNIGRLRIASKGRDRHPDYGKDPAAPRLVSLDPDEQWQRGMYMIGQVAALRDRVTTLAGLHQDVSATSSERLNALAAADQTDDAAPPPTDVAIVGLGTILPGAPDLESFWSNVLNKVDAVDEIPANRWDWRHYYDPDRNARDKVYSRWGGFIDDVPFDPIEFGMPPNSLRSIEAFQLLGLKVVQAALDDAGYADRPFSKERTSVMLGAGGGGADLTAGYMVRSSLPGLFGESSTGLAESLDGRLPEWTEDSFAGILMNVAAGRIANRFDFGGVNYTVDAACASSLTAVYLAVRDLQAGTSDVAIAGGVDAIQNPFAYLCFSKTYALSPTGRCRPFDAQADGIAISEGFAAIVLKRLSDAERDGDRIYAVIRGVGGASDGRDRSLTAPRPEGQIRALERAYANAGFSPSTVGLIEAHGTGTIAGDKAEVEALSTAFKRAGATKQGTAIGSVKSMIGHTKATAGVAGLVKTALALHHRVLPPTLGVSQPNPRANFPESPLYVNTETRPWIRGVEPYPRRAGVSAFGFGGTDFHVVLEEYTGGFLPEHEAVVDPWPAELLLWRAQSREEILAATTNLLDKLDQGAAPPLPDLAYTLAQDAGAVENAQATLAIVAESIEGVAGKLRQAHDYLQDGASRVHAPSGIHYSERPLAPAGQIAFLFPGQGSQTVNMARDLAVAFPEVRETFERADRTLAGCFEQPLSHYIFPPPVFTPEDEKRQQAALTETNVAQPALGATNLGYLYLLRSLGIEPQLAAGHSYGEFVALAAAGSLSEEALFLLSEARGRFMREGAEDESGTMAAVSASPGDLEPLLADPELTLANLNAPNQTVISGSKASIERAIQWCSERELRARQLPVACAFHSPFVAPAQQRLAEMLAATEIAEPRIPVFANMTAEAYPGEPERIASILGEHLTNPVQFVREIEAMYDAGARIFVEVGPRNVLTGLVGSILGDRQYLGVSLDQPGRLGLVQLLHSVAALAAEGVPVDTARIFKGRRVQRLDIQRLDSESGQPRYSASTWLVNGGQVRPLAQAASGESPPSPLRVAVLDSDDHGMRSAAPGSAPTPKEGLQTLGAGARLAGSQGNGVLHNDTSNGRIDDTHSSSDRTGSPAAVTGDRPSNIPAGQQSIRTAPEHIHREGEQMSSNRAGGSLNDPTTSQSAASTSASFSADSASSSRTDAQPLQPYAATTERASDVMARYQHVMQQFLETQRTVMLAYLGYHRSNGAPHHPVDRPGIAALGAGSAPLADSHYTPAPTHIPAEPVPAPVTMPSGNGASDHNGAGTMGAHPDTSAQPAEAIPPAANAEPPVHTPDPQAAPEPPTAAPDGAAGGALGREEIASRLLEVVSERTGYPPEMLDLDADLEADLGIDSIKRVEIAGTILQALTLPEGVTADIEQITTSQTLRQVIAGLEALVAPSTPAAAGEPVAASQTKDDGRPFDSEPAGDRIGRFMVQTSPAGPVASDADLAAEGVVVILDDETGVGEQLAEMLEVRGHATVRIASPDRQPPAGPAVLALDLASSESVQDGTAQLRERFGAAKALIQLTPLRFLAGHADSEMHEWQGRFERDVTGLFLMAQALQGDLESAAQSGGAAVLSATGMGGAFGSDGGQTPFLPDQGALAGFVKTLAQEWPSVRAKAVDLDDPSTAAERIVSELFAADGIVEVGYRAGERIVLNSVPESILEREPVAPMDRDSVVLITGGARGITAEAALRLAERYQPTLILVGRTPQPDDEDPRTAALTEPQEMRRAIIEMQRGAGHDVTPVAVEPIYQRLIGQREVRDNLTGLRRAGARVEYRACDVRDAEAFGALIDEIYLAHGRVDGVIHGAGIIEDKLIQDKRLDSFERVVSTKVASAFTLAAKIRPEGLRFFVMFSSVSGRFGNRGQADYAAASEVLNKLAQHLDRDWPGHIVSINWGPWLTTGMVSPEVQRQFASRGVELIPVDVGCRRLLEELTYGRKGEVEIVIGGAKGTDGRDHSLGAPRAPGATQTSQANKGASSLPLLMIESDVSRQPDGGVEVTRRLSPDHDLYLRDHRLDGRPVLPFAMAVEMMAEVAASAEPLGNVVEVRRARLLHGVSITGRDETVRVLARRTETQPSSATSLDVAIQSPGDQDRLNYRAAVELRSGAMADGAPVGNKPRIEQVTPEGLAPFPTTVEDAYARYLFHGPLFRGIVSIEGFGAQGAVALVRPSSPVDCLQGAGAAGWLIDPVIFDSALQVQVLWARLHWDVTLLPVEAESYRRFGPLLAGSDGEAPEAGAAAIRHVLRIRPESHAPLCHADHYFFSPDGRLLGILTNMTGAGSKALNRLAGPVSQ